MPLTGMRSMTGIKVGILMLAVCGNTAGAGEQGIKPDKSEIVVIGYPTAAVWDEGRRFESGLCICYVCFVGLSPCGHRIQNRAQRFP